MPEIKYTQIISKISFTVLEIIYPDSGAFGGYFKIFIFFKILHIVERDMSFNHCCLQKVSKNTLIFSLSNWR